MLAPVTLLLAAVGIAAPWPVVESARTAFVKKFADGWPKSAAGITEPAAGALRLRCLKTPGAKDYVGVEQVMVVDAPLADVAKVVEDIEGYATLYPDLEKVAVKGREGSAVLTEWEQSPPVVFMSSIKFSLVYFFGKNEGDARVYRYQLREKGALKGDDGVIALKALGPERTLYVGYDFIEPDVGGIGGVLAGNRVWMDTIKSLYVSDFAIRIKSEAPNMANDKALDRAKDRADKDKEVLEECFENRADPRP